MGRYILNDAEKVLVAALRSGAYLQTTNRLARTLDGQLRYCCLGVACKLLLPNERFRPEMESDGIPFVHYGRKGDELYERNCLPQEVQDKLGWATGLGHITIVSNEYDTEEAQGLLTTPVPHVFADDEYLSLALLNDDGFSFDQIADIIEAGFVLRSEDVNKTV